MTEENDPVFNTDIIVDGETIETVETPIYTFTISEKLNPDYRMAYRILTWLRDNMDSMLDDAEKKIFSKVNTGFDENIIKTFGRKPVCDVYIDSVEYDSEFENRLPIKVHSIVLFYMKGANNHTYLKACELHDYIMQEFITNNQFRFLSEVVKDTRIEDSEVRNEQIRGGYGVIGAFEITHDLY